MVEVPYKPFVPCTEIAPNGTTLCAYEEGHNGGHYNAGVSWRSLDVYKQHAR